VHVVRAQVVCHSKAPEFTTNLQQQQQQQQQQQRMMSYPSSCNDSFASIAAILQNAPGCFAYLPASSGMLIHAAQAAATSTLGSCRATAPADMTQSEAASCNLPNHTHLQKQELQPC
jgi:hypothetical protein